MKKILISLGLVAATAAPIATVVSCGKSTNEFYAKLGTPTKESTQISTRIDLDTITPENMLGKMEKIASEEINPLLTKENYADQKMQELAEKVNYGQVSDKDVIQAAKQIFLNYIYSVGVITTTETVSYKGSDFVFNHHSVDFTSFTSISEIENANEAYFSTIKNKLSSVVRKGFLQTQTAINALVTSPQYTSWLKDNVTDVNKDASSLYLMKFEPSLDGAPHVSIRLSLNPSANEIKNYVDQIEKWYDEVIAMINNN